MYGYFLILLLLNLIEAFLINFLQVRQIGRLLFWSGFAIIDADYFNLLHSTLLAWFLVLTETVFDLDFATEHTILFLLLLLDPVVLDQHVHFGLQYMAHHPPIEYYYPK